MTRIYRDRTAGWCWIERGDATPLVGVPDHGEAVWRWQRPADDGSVLVYDDAAAIAAADAFVPAADPGPSAADVLTDAVTDAITDERTRIADAVGASKLSAAAKAEIRKIIGA